VVIKESGGGERRRAGKPDRDEENRAALEARATRRPGSTLKARERMRKVTVTYSFRAPGYVPMIRLRGKWLNAAGFEEGTRVHVEVATGKITLSAVQETALKMLKIDAGEA
jgi:hypothetical protein